MIRKSAVIGMVMLLVITLLIIFSLNSTSGSKITGMFVIEPDTPLADINSIYSLVPLFEVNIDYSFDEYGKIENQARALLYHCRGSDPNLVNICVKDEITTMHGWNLVENQDFLYKFDVEGQKEIPLYDEQTKKMENKAVTYKFALDFSE